MGSGCDLSGMRAQIPNPSFLWECCIGEVYLQFWHRQAYLYGKKSNKCIILSSLFTVGLAMLHLSPVQPITEFLDASEVRNLVHLKGYFKGLLICGIIYLIVFCTMILRYVLFSNNADEVPASP